MKDVNNNYYVKIKPKMMKEFELMYKGTKRILREQYSEFEVESFYKKSKEEYGKLFALRGDARVLLAFEDGPVDHGREVLR